MMTRSKPHQSPPPPAVLGEGAGGWGRATTRLAFPILLAALLSTAAACTVQPAAPPLPTRPPTVTPDPWAAHGAPARISIPSIGVDAAIEALDLTPEQKIGVPKEWGHVGWYREGVRPGEQGKAILSGHFDDEKGRPAVFARLREVEPGDEVRVSYSDGSTVTFAAGERLLVDVNAVDQASWEAIFGASERAELSLITCEGVWDPRARTYSQRLVVFAAAP